MIVLASVRLPQQGIYFTNPGISYIFNVCAAFTRPIHRDRVLRLTPLTVEVSRRRIMQLSTASGRRHFGYRPIIVEQLRIVEISWHSLLLLLLSDSAVERSTTRAPWLKQQLLTLLIQIKLVQSVSLTRRRSSTEKCVLCVRCADIVLAKFQRNNRFDDVRKFRQKKAVYQKIPFL